MTRAHIQHLLLIPAILALWVLPAFAQPVPELPPLPGTQGSPPPLPGAATPLQATPAASPVSPVPAQMQPAPVTPPLPGAAAPLQATPAASPVSPVPAQMQSAPVTPPLPGAPAPGGMMPPMPAASPTALPNIGSLPAGSLPTVPPAMPAAVSGVPGMPLPVPSTTTAVPSQSPVPADGELPVLPDGSAAPVVPAPAQPARVFSYGKSDVSIIFLPEQIAKMKDAIQAWEGADRAVPAAPTFVGAEPEIIKEVIEEPEAYPVFYLSSIVYHNSADWAVWVSGFKITPRKNETDVNIVSVARDTVTFSWKPKYGEALTRRVNENIFAPTDAVKNKLARAQNVRFDDTTGSVIFSLNQNQSFAVGYFSTFEGFMETPKLDPLLSNTVAIGSNTVPPVPAPARPTPRPPASNPMGQGGPPLPSTPTFTMQPRQ